MRKPLENLKAASLSIALIAGVVDFLVVASLATMIAVFAYGPSGGAIRNGVSLWSASACAPRGVDTFCRVLVFGHEVDRELVTTREGYRYVAPGRYSSGGSFQMTLVASVPTDKNNRRATPFYIDWTEGLAALLVFAGLEGAVGATIGEALFGLRVVARDGGSPTLSGVLKRNVLVWGWWPLAGLLVANPPLLFQEVARGSDATIMRAGPIVLWLIVLALAATLPTDDPWLGQTSGVQLVRGRGAP